MYGIAWDFEIPLKNEKIFEQFESKYLLSIPNDLKKLIIQHNAGYPTPCKVNVPNLGEREIKLLLSYNREDDENIYQVIDDFCRNFHRRVLPFAVDSFSGYYCIKDNSIVVYVEDDDNALYPIAESISVFLCQLF